MTVEYALFEVGWGKMAVAWSGSGACLVSLPVGTFGEVEARALAAYPGARRVGERSAGGLVKQLRGYFAGEVKSFEAELDLGWATPFRQRVYRALARVPYGQTIGYAELARRAGRPGAARAAGSANACNRLPLIVPCHRVIKADGELGGFSGPGGVEFKRRLLEFEAEHS